MIQKFRTEKCYMGKIAKSKVTEYDPIHPTGSGGHKIKKQQNKTAAAVKKHRNGKT